MALRVNENVREEWDSIDFEDDSSDYKQRKAPVQSKNTNGTRDTNAKTKDKTKDWSPPRKNAPQNSIQEPVDRDSNFSQEHTGETQDCITIEPRPSIVPRDISTSVLDRQQQYKPWSLTTKQPANNDRTKNVDGPEGEDSTSGVPLSLSDGDQPKDTDYGTEHRKSSSGLDQDLIISSQETVSSIGETEDSLTEDEGSDLGSANVEVRDTINLPYDSDNEELKAAEEERIRAYTKTTRLVDAQNLDNKEDDSIEGTGNMKESLETPIISISSGNSMVDDNSQYSLKLVPGPSQLSNDHKNKQHSSPIKGNQTRIPVSSSTGISQNIQSLGSSDIQIQHTPSQPRIPEKAESKMKTPVASGAISMLVATSAKKQSPYKSPAKQNDSPGAALQRSAAAFSSPMRPRVPVRKHQRSSRESSVELYTAVRKRRRLESPIDLASTGRDAAQSLSPASAITPPSTSRHNRVIISTPQSTSAQKSYKVVEHLSSNIKQRSPVSRHPEQSEKSDQTRFKPHVMQKARHISEDIDFDHDLPRISASQPIPNRPRVRSAHQAKGSKPSPRIHIALPELVQPTVIRNEVLESPRSSSPEAAELDLEPLTKILDLQGADYCAAIKRDRVFTSLQHLYCEFLARHRTYLGDMNHLFNLCAWLLRNRADPDEQGCIDEDFWDDFILQHQQGKYDTYVKRSLAKFRQPGSWSVWYDQTEKGQPGNNVITAQRLEQILLGQEPVVKKQRIPFLWSRFKHAKLASVS